MSIARSSRIALVAEDRLAGGQVQSGVPRPAVRRYRLVRFGCVSSQQDRGARFAHLKATHD